MARYLPLTIESVLGQDYPAIEYIVVDGGSTDGTLDILRGYTPRLQYFTGKDKGPADAAHRGFREARGQIFAWLNADDTYLPGAVRRGVEYLLAHPEADVVYGEGYWVDEHGTVMDRYPTRSFDPKLLERDCFICQPTTFIRASAYRSCGLNPEVNQPFDYDLWIRMSKQGFHFASISEYLANGRPRPVLCALAALSVQICGQPADGVEVEPHQAVPFSGRVVYGPLQSPPPAPALPFRGPPSHLAKHFVKVRFTIHLS
jgi:glycosyltransferase involved in cell wall biosynthesis